MKELIVDDQDMTDDRRYSWHEPYSLLYAVIVVLTDFRMTT